MILFTRARGALDVLPHNVWDDGDAVDSAPPTVPSAVGCDTARVEEAGGDRGPALSNLWHISRAVLVRAPAAHPALSRDRARVQPAHRHHAPRLHVARRCGRTVETRPPAGNPAGHQHAARVVVPGRDRAPRAGPLGNIALAVRVVAPAVERPRVVDAARVELPRGHHLPLHAGRHPAHLSILVVTPTPPAQIHANAARVVVALGRGHRFPLRGVGRDRGLAAVVLPPAHTPALDGHAASVEAAGSHGLPERLRLLRHLRAIHQEGDRGPRHLDLPEAVVAPAHRHPVLADPTRVEPAGTERAGSSARRDGGLALSLGGGARGAGHAACRAVARLVGADGAEGARGHRARVDAERVVEARGGVGAVAADAEAAVGGVGGRRQRAEARRALHALAPEEDASALPRARHRQVRVLRAGRARLQPVPARRSHLARRPQAQRHRYDGAVACLRPRRNHLDRVVRVDDQVGREPLPLGRLHPVVPRPVGDLGGGGTRKEAVPDVGADAVGDESDRELHHQPLLRRVPQRLRVRPRDGVLELVTHQPVGQHTARPEQ
eukprot:2127777-Rhodomonas_salina.1